MANLRGRRTAARSLSGALATATTRSTSMNADGSGQTRLTNNTAYDDDPDAALPVAGREPKIAFTSPRDGNYEIYVMNADGSDQTTAHEQLRDTNRSRLVAGRQQDRLHEHPRRQRRDLRHERRRLGPDAADEQPGVGLAARPGRRTASKIAFDSLRDGNAEIYVMNADGSGQTRLTTTRRPTSPCLVAGRQQDRFREHPRRQLARSTS